MAVKKNLFVAVVVLFFRIGIAKAGDSNESTVEDERQERTSRQLVSPPSPLYEGCGKTKGCFGSPPGCFENFSCQLAASYRKFNENVYDFELLGRPPSTLPILDKQGVYVAMGFSVDGRMSGSVSTECVAIGRSVTVTSSYNEGYKNTRVLNLNPNITLQIFTFDNGTIYCKFSRNATFTVNQRTINLRKNNYYLLLALGPAEPGQIMKHRSKVSTSSPIEFDPQVPSSNEYNELDENGLKTVHAVFMTVAWIGFASAGIFLPRYHQGSWQGKTLGGNKVWLTIHRCLMTLAFTLVLIGFIVIFVAVGGWVHDDDETAVAHAVLGVIITVLAIVQLLGGIFRPDKNSQYRILFSYAHKIVGYGSFVLAMINIFLGSLIRDGVPRWSGYILLIFVFFFLWVQLGHMFVSRPRQVADKAGHVEKVTASELLWYAYIFFAIFFTLFLSSLYGQTTFGVGVLSKLHQFQPV